MKVAIVGCGTIGSKYADNFIRMKQVELVAVLANKTDTAERFAETYSTRGFVSFDEMMETTDPDVICIALPNYLHKEFVLKIAGYGKNIICEKPLALSMEDADEMIKICEVSGVKLFVSHVVRFFPQYQNFRQTVQSGAIGEIKVVHTKRNSPYPYTKSDWYADSSKSGGIIMDLMIHDIDFLLWTMGNVVSVYAMQRQAAGIDYALVTLRFENGALANLEGMWGYPDSFITTAECAGTLGIVRLDSAAAAPMKLLRKTEETHDRLSVELPESSSENDPYYAELLHFIDCLKQGTDPLVTALNARDAVEVAIAAQVSLETGAPYAISKRSVITQGGRVNG